MPWGETWVRASRQFEVAGRRGGRTFVVDDDPGIGYLFAVASPRPLDFDDIARGDHWDYRAVEGRVVGLELRIEPRYQPELGKHRLFLTFLQGFPSRSMSLVTRPLVNIYALGGTP